MTSARPTTSARPRRVAVVGTSGSGKTTFSIRLADRLGVRHVELDAHFWQPDWQQPDRDAFNERMIAILAGLDGWVCDGNYGSIAADHADTIVWLDLPLRTCLWRVLRRAVRRARQREILWGTNHESWSRLIGRESLAWWVLTTHGRRRRDLTELFGAPAYRHLRRVRLLSSAEADAWLASV
jgi:adenylate kinase family enzyme